MPPVVEKYKAAGHTFLRGTSSDESYLVIARDKETGAQLGLKPIVFGGYVAGEHPRKVLFCGYRVRLAPPHVALQSVDEDAYGEPKTPASWPTAFAALPWAKSDYRRKSFVLGVMLGRDPETAWAAGWDLDEIDFAQKTVEWVQTHIPRGALVGGPGKLSEFVNDSFVELLSNMPGPETIATLDVKIAQLDAAIAQLTAEKDALVAKKTTLTLEGPLLAPPTTHVTTELLTGGQINDLLAQNNSAPMFESAGDAGGGEVSSTEGEDDLSE